MVFDIYVLIEAIYLIIPAYAANGLVPIIKGKHPIDFGKKLFGKPVLGPGKTWEGLIFGCIIGTIIATIMMFAHPFLPWDASPVALNIVPMTPLLGFLMGLGAMVFDSIGSFIKRRFGLKRGQAAPLLDQEDFLVGALVFASLLVSVQLGWWIWLLIITPIIHWIASMIGYLIKIKKEPY